MTSRKRRSFERDLSEEEALIRTNHFQEKSPPRNIKFSLAELLVWSALASVFLMLDSARNNLIRSIYPDIMTQSWALWWNTFTGSLLSALALMGMFRVLVTGVSLLRFQPGHWILLVSGIAVVTCTSGDLWMIRNFKGDMGRLEVDTAVALFSDGFPSAVGYAAAAALLKGNHYWRAFFCWQASLGFWNASWAMAYFLGSPLYGIELSLPAFIGSGILYSLAVYQSVLRQSATSSLHWIGVFYLGLRLVSGVVTLGLQLFE